MAEDTQLAFVQNALSVSGPNAPVEGSALQNELFRRLLASGIAIDTSGNITATALIQTTPNVTNATGTLPVAHGGSGAVTLAAHGVVVGNGTTAVNVTGAGTSGQLLTSNGASADPTFQGLTLAALANQGTTTTVLHGNAAGTPAFGPVSLTADVVNQGTTTTLLHGNAAGSPTFGAVSLTADVSGTLPVTNGGTGVATLTTAYGVVTAGTTATGTVQTITPGAAGTILRSGGSAAVPTWVANGAPTVFALTDGSTPALDASLGTVFTLSAAGDRTIAVPTNPTSGQKIIIQHLASGGARTLALNTGAGGFRFGTDIPSLSQTTSGKTDYIGCVYNAGASFWDVVAVTKGF